MDIHSIICYAMGYATLWHPSAAGSTKTSSRSSTASWQDVSICGRDSKLLDKLCSALGPELSPRWGSRSSVEANTWASAAVLPVAEAQAPATAEQRALRSRIHDRPLDPATDCQADRKALRDSLPPGPCVAGDDESRMDVAEAATSGHTKRRGNHRPLEEIRVAGYKKKPEDLGPISYFSTKAGFSSSLTSARPGHRSGRRPSSDTAIGEIGFLPSLPSPYPRCGSGLDFTSVCTASTSLVWRSSDSCTTFSGTCAGRLYSFGMAAPSTGVSSLRSFCAATSASMCIGSRPIPRSLTLTSSCGQRPNTPCPTVRPRTSLCLDADSVAQSTASETPSDFFDPVFMLRICHGLDDVYIHYLCEDQ